jgi:glycerophosphoryl diester phosphodiesterase
MIKIIIAVMVFTSIFLFSNAKGKEKTLSIAHRGGSVCRPENTMAAFKNAIKMGVDYIELDVHMSKDGYPVVIHDASLERTTNGTGKVEDKTLEELKKLNAGSWFSDEFIGEKLPTLEEVMDLAKNKTGIVIEIKKGDNLYDGIEEKIVKLIRDKDMVHDVIVISFNYELLKKVHELDGHIATGLLYGGNKPDICKMAHDAGIDYISPSWQTVTEDMIKEAHSVNIKVRAFRSTSPLWIWALLQYSSYLFL